MRIGAFMARESIVRLRRQIAELEGRPQECGLPAMPDGTLSRPTAFALAADSQLLPFAVPALDHRLGGGLRRNALHEIRGEETHDAPAATGFATALLARLATTDRRPILWVMEAAAGREAGLPYGLGLDHLGLDPKRLVLVRVRRPAEALWVLEEGLRCCGLAAAVAEIRGTPRELDLTANRRLALRARESAVMGLLLRQAGAVLPGAAATRWRVTPRPAAVSGDFSAGIGRPVWRLVLEHSRNGATGTFDLEWDHGSATFAVAGAATALPVPLPALSFDRPDLPAEAGPHVALRRAS